MSQENKNIFDGATDRFAAIAEQKAKKLADPKSAEATLIEADTGFVGETRDEAVLQRFTRGIELMLEIAKENASLYDFGYDSAENRTERHVHVWADFGTVAQIMPDDVMAAWRELTSLSDALYFALTKDNQRLRMTFTFYNLWV